VPTMRVGLKGSHTTLSDHASPVTPDLEDYPVNWNTDTLKVRSSRNPKLEEEIYLANQIHSWNRKISDLGARSAVLHYLTGEEKYAALASDIFMQWALGIYYQNAPKNPEGEQVPCGFLNGHDLNDGNYKTMAVSYDYCHDYLLANEPRYLGKLKADGHLAGETIPSIADAAFYKFLKDGIFIGGWAQDIESPNNHTMKASEQIWMALAIDNNAMRDECMEIFLHHNPELKKTTNPIWKGAWLGQVPWDIFHERSLDEETGLWKEPPGYHNFPMRAAVRAAAALDANGYAPYKTYPKLLKAQYALFRFAFPNGTSIEYGDSSPSSYPDPVNLEFALAGARNAGMVETEATLTAYLKLMIDQGQYTRRAGFKQLLTFVPELAETAELGDFMPRADTIPYAGAYLQRLRGNDSENGLMYQVNAGRYTHYQYKGIDMELYGPGRAVSSHSGTLYPYGNKLMTEFYVRSAAANTVVPGAQQLNRNFHPLELLHMEPMPGAAPRSPECSFTEVGFDFNGTRQRRITALVATPETGGFYIDIFHSNHPERNDALFHNIGKDLTLFSTNGKKLPMVGSERFSETAPGYQYYRDKQETAANGTVVARFEAEDLEGKPVHTTAFFACIEGDMVVTATSPYTFKNPNKKQRPKEISRKTVAIQRSGDAWNKPFITVVEPARPGNETITNVQRTELNGGTAVAIEIKTRDLTYVVLSNLDPATPVSHKGVKLDGGFGIACFNNAARTAKYLYLGHGKSLAFGDQRVD
jgi:hypothetical protein